MGPAVRISDVLAREIRLDPHQAVALVRALIDELKRAPGEPAPTDASLTAECLELLADGTVRCECAGAQPILEVARLLNSLLPRHGHVPGALRYTIARAEQDVDAPPFGSLEEFSAALARFEKGSGREALTALYADAAAGSTSPVIPPVSASPAPTPVSAPSPQFSPRPASPPPQKLLADRRRKMPSATELRRQLREADRQLFEARARLEPPAPSSVPPPLALRSPSPTPRQLAAVGAALALGASFFFGYAAFLPQREGPSAVGSTGTVTTGSAPDAARAEVPAAPASVEESATSVLEDGTVLTLTRAIAGPSFSPVFTRDGTTLFYQTGQDEDGDSALMLQELPGGSPVPVLNDGAKNFHAQPSPDGTRIAFDSDREGERGVYIVDRTGGNAQRLSGSGYGAVPAWSPDGKRMTFVRAEENNPRVWNVWILALDTGEVRRITDFTSGQAWASWFPDGSRICYSREDRLTVLDVDRGRWRRYGSPIAGSPVRTPAVSPDGSQVIFQVSGSGAWLLDLESGSMRRVLDDPSAEEFAWSPDGRRVAFHSRRSGDWGVWIMALT